MDQTAQYVQLIIFHQCILTSYLLKGDGSETIPIIFFSGERTDLGMR